MAILVYRSVVWWAMMYCITFAKQPEWTSQKWFCLASAGGPDCRMVPKWYPERCPSVFKNNYVLHQTQPLDSFCIHVSVTFPSCVAWEEDLARAFASLILAFEAVFRWFLLPFWPLQSTWHASGSPSECPESWKSRWWFQIFFIFTPIWGRFPCWLIFFRWVETTNQKFVVFINCWCFFEPLEKGSRFFRSRCQSIENDLIRTSASYCGADDQLQTWTCRREGHDK